MRTIGKWVGIVLGLLIALAAALLVIVFAVSGSRFNRTYKIPAVPIAVGVDDEARGRDEHLAAIRGCTDCHGENLGGEIFSDDFLFGTF